MQAEISLSYKKAEDAETVAKSISPDNYKAPSGLSIETSRKGKEVLTHITCEERLPAFIATIDDLLFCVSIVEKTLLIIKRVEGQS